MALWLCNGNNKHTSPATKMTFRNGQITKNQQFLIALLILYLPLFFKIDGQHGYVVFFFCFSACLFSVCWILVVYRVHETSNDSNEDKDWKKQNYQSFAAFAFNFLINQPCT
jgi:Na+/melibiose symporter-like transporter